MKGYIEQTILGSKESLEPFTKGVSKLQEMLRELARGNKSQGDISSVLTQLSPPFSRNKGRASASEERSKGEEGCLCSGG